MTSHEERLRAIELARKEFTRGAFLLSEPPYRIEVVADAILCAAIALLKLREADPEDKARELASEALRIERDRRFNKENP